MQTVKVLRKVFTWSIDEINSVLNKEEAEKIISNFNLTKEGNFEGKISYLKMKILIMKKKNYF